VLQRQLRFTDEAARQLAALKKNSAKESLCKQVLKTLGLLEVNTAHPGLKTHEFSSFKGAHDERVWEAYAQNRTPGAYRVFFHYGPDEKKGSQRLPVLTIVAITPHP
jgi:hypothetical protein